MFSLGFLELRRMHDQLVSQLVSIEEHLDRAVIGGSAEMPIFADELLSGSMDRVAEALLDLHAGLDKRGDTSVPGECVQATGDSDGSSATLSGSVYGDFSELPEDIQERVLPFFFGESPDPGVLDGIYVFEGGWGASISFPPITDDSLRALARISIMLYSENQEIERDYVDECILNNEFDPYPSNQEAIAAAGKLEHGTVQEIEPGLFGVFDLSPLFSSRPDFTFRESMYDLVVAELARRGHKNHTALHARWEDAPQ